MPGKNTIIVKMVYNTPESISYYDDEVEISTVGIEGLHPMFYELIKTRDIEVIKKYFPWGNGLKAFIKGSIGRVEVRYIYKNKEIAVLTVNNDSNIVKGMGIFRNGIAKIKVPLKNFREIEENLRFGKIPDKYVEEVLATYIGLKEDVETQFYGSYNGNGGRDKVRFMKGDYWSNYCEVTVDFSRNEAVYSCNKKTKKASVKALPKYLKETGMLCG